MLTGMHVAFLGGDARQLEVIRTLSERDAIVTLIGFDNLQQQFAGATKAELSPELLASVDVLILPAVLNEDSGKINSLFSTDALTLEDQHVAALPEHALVCTGAAKPFLKEICSRHNKELVELFERDDVAIYNSIPTAEGAVMMAIENTDFTIHGSHCAVLGLGRTGMTLARTLQGLGATVSVGVRKPEHEARAKEMGFQPFSSSELTTIAPDIDLLFNTVPTMVVTAQVIAALPHRCLIIDLASKPGGTDFRFAQKRGIKAMLAPGLPGIVAPKTAGQIIANCLVQLLSERSRKRRNA